jgi:hypothetical protein
MMNNVTSFTRTGTAVIARLVLIIITCLTLLAGSPAIGAQSTIIIFYSRNGMSTSPDGSVSPLMAEWQQLLEKASGYHLELRQLQVSKALDSLSERNDACYTGIIRTPEREHLVDWISPVAYDRVIIIGTRKDPFSGPLQALDEVAEGSVAAPDGANFDLLQRQGIRARRVADHAAALTLVRQGKARFALTMHSSLRNLPPEAAVELREIISVQSIPAWLGCGLNMPEDLRRHLRTTLTGLLAGQPLRNLMTRMTGTAPP